MSLKLNFPFPGQQTRAQRKISYFRILIGKGPAPDKISSIRSLPSLEFSPGLMCFDVEVFEMSLVRKESCEELLQESTNNPVHISSKSSLVLGKSPRKI